MLKKLRAALTALLIAITLFPQVACGAPAPTIPTFSVGSSVGAIAANRRRGTVSGGTSGTTLRLGFNTDVGYYGAQQVIENDYSHAGDIVTRPSNNSLPAANYGADGWPTGLPAGETAYSYVFRGPETSGIQILVPLTPNSATAVVVNGGSGGTVSSFNAATGDVIVTTTTGHPTTTGFSLNITPNGSAVPKLRGPAREVGNASAYVASFGTHITDVTTSDGAIRTMKRSGVEANEGITVSSLTAGYGGTNSAGVFPAAVLTSANRSTPTTGNWDPYTGTGRPRDGFPMETDLALASTYHRALHRNIPWNADNTYIDAVGDLGAQAALTGTSTYWEVSNEVWLFAYPVAKQADWEAISEKLPAATTPTQVPADVTATISGTTLNVTAVASGGPIAVGQLVHGDGLNIGEATIASLGTGTGGVGTYNLNVSKTLASRRFVINSGLRGERDVEKTIDVMDRIKARYVAAEVANGLAAGTLTAKFLPVYTTEYDSAPFYAPYYLDYAPPGKTALKNHIKYFMGGLYIDHSGVPSSSTDVQAYINALFDTLDTEVDVDWKGLVDAAVARGVMPGAYEAGAALYVDDPTTRAAVKADPNFKKWVMHYLARVERVSPAGTPIDIFVLPGLDFSNQSFGVLASSGQAPTQYYNALKDYKNGKRALVPLAGTLTASAGAPVGAQVGVLKRRNPGSTVTISSTPPGALAFSDPAAQSLQVVVANAAPFASAGSIAWDVLEADARDVDGIGFKHTTGTLSIVGGTVFDIARTDVAISLTGSNLTATRTGGGGTDKTAYSTVAKTAGYAEFTIRGSGSMVVGVDDGTLPTNMWPGNSATSASYQNNGSILNNGALAATGSSYADTNTTAVAVKAGKVWFGKWNGSVMVWQGTGTQDPSAGTGGFPIGSGAMYIVVDLISNSQGVTANYGGSTFLGTPPTGTVNYQ